MSDTDFIVVYVGWTDGRTSGDSIPRYNIGDRLRVPDIVGIQPCWITNVSLSSTTGHTYYAIALQSNFCGWYNAELFKRLDDIREERLQELGI